MLSDTVVKITELDQIFDEDEDSQQVREGRERFRQNEVSSSSSSSSSSLQSMESSSLPVADAVMAKEEQGEASRVAMVTMAHPLV